MRLSAHCWTVLPYLNDRLRPPIPPTATRWHTEIRSSLGPVPLRGFLHVPDGAREVVVLLHGLAGTASSTYLARAARAAAGAGVASLRLSLRGADGDGTDLYHAGLGSDLQAVVDHPALAGFERIFLWGYSLGGHIALRAATGDIVEPRLARVASVCSPLDLARAQQGIDAPAAAIYRRVILRKLRAAYAVVAARHPDLPGDPEGVRTTTTLRGFDAASVVPRFGFDSVDDYYRRASVGPRLGRLSVPALLVAVRDDPMVPAASIDPSARGVSGVELRWLGRGGHVHVPAKVDLGLGTPRSLESQVMDWLRST